MTRLVPSQCICSIGRAVLDAHVLHGLRHGMHSLFDFNRSDGPNAADTEGFDLSQLAWVQNEAVLFDRLVKLPEFVA